MSRLFVAFFTLLSISVSAVHGDYEVRPDPQITIRVQTNKDNIVRVTYYINGSLKTSEIERKLGEYRSAFDGHPESVWFEDAEVVFDTVPAWLMKKKQLEFLRSRVDLNDKILSNVVSLSYDVAMFDPAFYRSFPSLKSVSVRAPNIRSLAFLSEYTELNSVRISTGEQDKQVLTEMFLQLASYLTSPRNRREGFVDFVTPYHYPNYNPDEDVFQYYAEPPAWYKGPDISGVPAWLNDDGVRLRAGPSQKSAILKVMRKGDYVLIKGRAGVIELDQPWVDEDHFRQEQTGETAGWVKVRLENRTTGYIWGPYLSLKNPNFLSR